MAVLKLGDKGFDVRKLQMLLNSALIPSPNLREDGDFGARTRDAVARLQKLKGLVEDGIVGPATWAALGLRMSGQPRINEPHASTSWMAIAQAELGVHEDSLPGHHSQRIIEYHRTTTLRATTDEVPWCSSFVNWVMTKAGYRGTNNALAKSWLDWGSALNAAKDGAIAVIKRKGATSDVATGSATGFHVGFYVNSPPTHVRLLGGNQGDQVKYSSFSLNAYEIRGYRWPR